MINDLGGTRLFKTYTIINDQQKVKKNYILLHFLIYYKFTFYTNSSSTLQQGLLPAIDEFAERIEQRFCVRHLYNNFRKKHPGMKLKQLMWRAANATYANAFEREMKEIKSISEGAFEYLMNIPPRHWSKAFFKTGSKCDTLVNNMLEAFNSVIVNGRSKPVITNMEEIRVYMMERWQKNREKISRYGDGVLPNIKKKLEKESSYTKNWLVR